MAIDKERQICETQKENMNNVSLEEEKVEGRLDIKEKFINEFGNYLDKKVGENSNYTYQTFLDFIQKIIQLENEREKEIYNHKKAWILDVLEKQLPFEYIKKQIQTILLNNIKRMKP